MQQSYAIPVAIVIAGALIAGAVFMTMSDGNTNANTSNNTDTQQQAQNDDGPGNEVDVRPVSEDDWIRGNPDADITIIEYTDYECPFCKRYHSTMNRIMEKYGKDGDVAWVVRHSPLEQLHPQAPTVGQAAECAGIVGGNDAFWEFSDRVFEAIPQQGSIDLQQLPQIAADIGLDAQQFSDCREGDQAKQAVQEDLQEAVEAQGGRPGTPFNVVVSDSTQIGFSGAVRFNTLDSVIQSILNGAIPSEALPQRG